MFLFHFPPQLEIWEYFKIRHSHVNRLCSGCYMYLRVIHRLRKSLTKKHRLLAVQSFVLSRLKYCTPVLIGLNDKLVSKLQLVHYAAIRTVLEFKKSDRISHHLINHNWLSIEYLIKYRFLLLLDSVLFHSSPKYLCERIRFHDNARSLRSILSQRLTSNRTRTHAADKAFSNFALHLWNSLPQFLRNSSIKSFP